MEVEYSESHCSVNRYVFMQGGKGRGCDTADAGSCRAERGRVLSQVDLFPRRAHHTVTACVSTAHCLLPWGHGRGRDQCPGHSRSVHYNGLTTNNSISPAVQNRSWPLVNPSGKAPPWHEEGWLDGSRWSAYRPSRWRRAVVGWLHLNARC